MDHRELSNKALIKHRISPQAATAPGQGGDEPKRLLHELQVHQIELEAQNRELREAQQALEESRDRYAELYDFAPVGYVTLDDKGVIRELNLTAANMLGRERSRWLGMPFAGPVANGSKRQFLTHIRQVFQSGQRGVTELKMESAGAAPLYLRLESVLPGYAHEKPKVCHTAMIDITEREAIAEALRGREEVLRRLLQTTGEGIYGLDLEGRVTICNPSCVRFLGYADANELLGRHMHSLIHHSRSDGQPYPDPECPLHGAMRTGKAIHVEGDLFYRKDGTRFPVAYRSVPLREGERLVGAVVSFSDITERLQAEEVRRQMERTLRRHQQALLEIGNDLTSGRGLQQQLGSLAEIAGRTLEVARTSIWEQDPEATRIRCLDLYERHPRRHTRGMELLRRHYPGYFQALQRAGIIDAEDARSDPRTREYTESYLEPLGITSMLDAAIIAGDRRTGVLCFEHTGAPRRWSIEEVNFAHSVADLAALALTLDELRKTVTALRESEGRVQEHTAHLEAANQELKAFSYIVSHDMRAPLINIGGYAGELRFLLDEMKNAMAASLDRLEPDARTKIDRLVEQDVPEALGFIQGSVQKLERQIDGILRLSRLGQIDLQPETRDLRALVTETLESLAHRVDAAKATITVRELPAIVCDRNAVELVIGNLLDNAVKYLDSHRPGRIEVDAERAPGRVVVHVKDNGRGIAEEDLDKVFHVFRRAGDQDTPGDGMGLAYVKAVVQRLGGNIRCQSVLGEGCTFSFDIPDFCCQTAKSARERHDIVGS